jgi:hypothetical protein
MLRDAPLSGDASGDIVQFLLRQLGCFRFLLGSLGLFNLPRFFVHGVSPF